MDKEAKLAEIEERLAKIEASLNDVLSKEELKAAIAYAFDSMPPKSDISHV